MVRYFRLSMELAKSQLTGSARPAHGPGPTGRPALCLLLPSRKIWDEVTYRFKDPSGYIIFNQKYRSVLGFLLGDDRDYLDLEIKVATGFVSR